MMGLDFFRRAIDLERTYARPGQRILNTIQTNGTLLTEEWGEFLKANEFLAGISIDGPPTMRDAYRADKGGKPTFDRVMKGLEVFKRHQVDWNVLTTVHAVNGARGREVYRFLRGKLADRGEQAGRGQQRDGDERGNLLARLRLIPSSSPLTWSFPLAFTISSALTRGPAVTLADRRHPLRRSSGSPPNRPCHSEVAGQGTACRL